MTDIPEVSVALLTFNEKLSNLEECIDSILTQKNVNLELVVVLETEDTNTHYLKSLSDKDDRVKVFQCQSRMGKSKCLNRAIQISKSNFILRIDSDDCALPTRAELQLKHLQGDKSLAAVGSHLQLIDQESNSIGIRKYPIGPIQVKKMFALGNQLPGPGVMFRKDAVERVGGYTTGLNLAEDLDLWLKLLAQGYEVDNLPYFLTRYRTSMKTMRARGKNDWRVVMATRLSLSFKIWPFPLACLSVFCSLVIMLIPTQIIKLVGDSKLGQMLRGLKTGERSYE